MNKQFAARAIALTLAGVLGTGAFATSFAQSEAPAAQDAAQAPAPGPMGPQQRGPHFDPQRMQQRMELRLQRLHDALKLTAEQKTAWEVFRGVIADRAARGPQAGMKQQAAAAPATAVERMRLREEGLRTHLESLVTNRKAVEEFYGKLDATQKQVFDREFMPFGGPQAGARQGRRGPGAGPMGVPPCAGGQQPMPPQ